MNSLDVMRHGHATVMKTIDGLAAEHWEGTEVVGVWSTKHVIAHLSSFEAILIDVLTAIQDESVSTPVLDELLAGPARFNDAQVALRDPFTPNEVLSEYERNFERALELARALPEHVFTRDGLLEWYGSEYDLDDFVAYMFYGHKREHTAQITLFRKAIERGR